MDRRTGPGKRRKDAAGDKKSVAVSKDQRLIILAAILFWPRRRTSFFQGLMLKR
jgi:hypothetical protein